MEKELSLLDKVDLRIALAETDDQLQNSLKMYLCPVILKLASEHQQVRQTVFKMLQNIMKRTTSSRSIQFPVKALLDQAKRPNVGQNVDASNVVLYSLLFLLKGIERLSQEQKRELMPQVIHSFCQFQSSSQKGRIFNIFVKLVSGWKAPEHETMAYHGLIKDLDFAQYQDEKKVLVGWISKFLLLQPSQDSAVAQPGLSAADVAFFTTDAGVKYTTSQQILDVKKDLLEVLKVGFDSEDLKVPLLIASCDSSSVIKDYADVMYRKLNVDLEDEKFVGTMISLFTGDPATSTSPANSVLQERILSQLTKSVVATKHSDISKVTTLGLASDNKRLKQTTIAFVKWISINNENGANKASESMKQFNTGMARRLKESILNEGWPKVQVEQGKSYGSMVSHRQTQYEALGSILKTTPELFVDDFTYLEFLFESLEGEDVDMRSSLQEVLSSLVVYLPQCSSAVKEQIKIYGQRYLQADNTSNANIHACRFVILKYINSTFPFDDCEARYLNILGTSKANRPETIEEATKGLHPHWFNVGQASNTLEFKSTRELLGHGTASHKFPDFAQLVGFLRAKIDDAADSMHPGDQVIFQSMGKAVEFCVQTSIMQAIGDNKTVVVADEDWGVRLEKAFEVDEKVRSLLTKEIARDPQPFKTLLTVIFGAFEKQHQGSQDVTFETTFVRLLSLSCHELVGELGHLVDPLLRIMDERTLADITLSQLAKSVGIIASHHSSSSGGLVALLNKLIGVELPAHKAKANILVTAYIVSRLAYRERIDILQTVDLNAYLAKILGYLKEPTSYYQALECIGELALYGVLGPQLSFADGAYIAEVVEVMKPKVKKCDEKSVLVLSYLNLALPRDTSAVPTTGTVLERLTEFERLVYDTHVSKQTEYLFTSGETFSIFGLGWKSKVLTRAVDIQGCQVAYVPEINRLDVILEMVLTSCANTKPALRRAGCIWLLSVVEYCHGDDQELIKQQSSKIHLAFMKFLADRDELVQEAASRGLSLVYELGDINLKENLVKGLLKSFTDQNSGTGMISGTVDQDTELFDSDVLKTHDGSVSTYRDVLNLASDVGDPSLVYKFMSLAKSSALWSSRKGMAFGLGSILSKTSLDEMLSKNKSLANRLIPKLYRYKYDPMTSVSNSMQDIWNVLVDDSSKTIKAHFKDILQELLKGMGNKEWRVRQASTTALNDLLNVVDFATYEHDLPEIWNMSFRIMDDIKDSVRKEGNKVTKLLSRILINNKQGDGSSGVGELIPFLLGNKGLLSDAEDIRNFALETILKLIKSDNKSVKPYVPTLLENFIGLMSTLEPEVINYLILNADKYNLKNNDIDAKRLQSMGHSPMMEAIDRLIDSLDYEIMAESVDAIISSIKKSIGLPSKVCGSKVLVSLINKKYELTKPYGEKLFKVAVGQIKDKNDTISSSYSISVGYLSRLAPLEAVIQYGKKLQKMYFESEDNERERLIASVASENFSKYSNEKFEMVSSEFLPLTFIGMNDINKDIAKNFEKQWIETTSGSNVLKLYLNEIIDMVSKYISSPSYQIRQNLARSVLKLTNDINDFSNLPSDLITKVFEILLESCKGKSWSGKELILEALINYSIKLESFLSKNDTLRASINKVVFVEAKRRNKEYQKQAIQLVGKYLHEFPPGPNDTEEIMEVYVDVMTQILEDEYDEDDDNDEEEETHRNKKRNNVNSKLEEQKIKYLTNLFGTFTGKHPDEQLFKAMVSSLTKLLGDKNKFEMTWRSKICGNELFAAVVDSLDTDFHTSEFLTLWERLYEQCSSNNNIENVKIKFIRTSKTFIKYLENVHYLEEVKRIKGLLGVFENSSTVVQGELVKD